MNTNHTQTLIELADITAIVAIPSLHLWTSTHYTNPDSSFGMRQFYLQQFAYALLLLSIIAYGLIRPLISNK